VPNDVARSDLPFDENAKLSDYVEIKSDSGNYFWIEVKNKDTGSKVYKLEGFLLDTLFNMIIATVYLDKTNYKGIMGLSDQIRNDVFLKDGVYTLWNRNDNTEADGQFPGKNSHGSSPFYMGKAEDASGSWVGVYHNSAAASDWWIYNDDTNGQAYIETYAVGGIGDIYIMTGDKPDTVV
jgi:hypothetical protein